MTDPTPTPTPADHAEARDIMALRASGYVMQDAIAFALARRSAEVNLQWASTVARDAEERDTLRAENERLRKELSDSNVHIECAELASGEKCIGEGEPGIPMSDVRRCEMARAALAGEAGDD